MRLGRGFDDGLWFGLRLQPRSRALPTREWMADGERTRAETILCGKGHRAVLNERGCLGRLFVGMLLYHFKTYACAYNRSICSSRDTDRA